jgi:cobalt/nickel transport system permease protein
MHIPDGFLSTPVWAAAGAVSAGTVGYSLHKLNNSLEDSQIPLMGVTGAFIFAAQMVNFPIAGGTSGHLAGAVLAALLLGPHGAILVMAAILVIQALLFGDGGITALGANILNMGVIGALTGYGFYRLFQRLFTGPRGGVTAAFLAAWIAVVLSSAAAALQIGLSGAVPLRLVLPAMVGVHALIGIGEGLITAAALGFLLRVRRDLVFPACRPLVSGSAI